MNIKNDFEADNILNTLRLLYVEDDSEALMELAHFLKKRVSSLTTATNGVEALALIEKQSFDAIICDLWMPEMDGLSLIKRIRDDGLKTPVIITSAFSDSDTILKTVDLGIVKYCVKPIEVEELMEALKTIAIENLSEGGKFLSIDDKLIDRQERLELEKTLKSGFSHILKGLTGKGPKKVQVALGANELEISANGILSTIENSLLATENHGGIVSYIRKSLYESYRVDFEKLVSETIKRSATLEEIKNEVEEDTDCLIFKLS